MEQISKHISYAEATFTQTRLNNVPSNVELEAMKTIAEKVFEPMREGLGGLPISISSFYRSKEVNKKIGGAKNSQHTFGEAIDINSRILGFVSNKEVFEYIKDNLNFDQLIAEDLQENDISWVHVSYTNRYPLRNQVLVMIKNGNKSEYFNYNNSLNKKDYA